MRNAFITTLNKQAKRDKRIMLLTGDLGFTVFESFMKLFPDRFINVGVAEANMVGIAAGLAHSGKIPVIYSIATFMSMRAFEQIRNDIALPASNVKIVGTGGGLAYGPAGPTHHSLEDVALMRALPNIKVLVPSDPTMTKWLTKTAIRTKGPVYLRIGKKGEPNIYKKGEKFALTKGKVVKKGKDVTLISTGSILEQVIAAAKLLTRDKITAEIIDIHAVKPIDKNLILKSAKKTNYIFTIEEHSIIGGLGSAVAEVLAEEANFSYVFKRIGIQDTFCQTIGSHQYLRHYHGLSAEKISEEVSRTMKQPLSS